MLAGDSILATPGGGVMSRCLLAHDLTQSERRVLRAMSEINFGRFELLRIQRGELVLDPWPRTVRGVKFGFQDSPTNKEIEDGFELRAAVRKFFEYVRSIDDGEILRLEFQHGMPFRMEIEHRPEMNSGCAARE